MGKKVIIFIRHAEKAYDNGQYLPVFDPPIVRNQYDKFDKVLKDIEPLIGNLESAKITWACSPFLRTVQTLKKLTDDDFFKIDPDACEILMHQDTRRVEKMPLNQLVHAESKLTKDFIVSLTRETKKETIERATFAFIKAFQRANDVSITISHGYLMFLAYSHLERIFPNHKIVHELPKKNYFECLGGFAVLFDQDEKEIYVYDF